LFIYDFLLYSCNAVAANYSGDTMFYTCLLFGFSLIMAQKDPKYADEKANM